MVINRKGKKLVRKMELFSKKFGPDERGLIKFVDPPDARGIMYLTWSYEDINWDDDIWVFLPAKSLIRRISGGGKKGSFMRGIQRDANDFIRFSFYCWSLVEIGDITQERNDEYI